MPLESMDGDTLQIAFNGVYLSEFLRSAHSDQVEIALQSDDKSARLRPFPLQSEGLSLEYIAMPVRLRGVEEVAP